MKKFLGNNLLWLKKYFYKTKRVFEILALFFVLQAFLYSIDLKLYSDITEKEISALKIIFWVLIFLITLLLYIETEIEYTTEDDNIMTSIFTGAVLSKYVMRLLIYTLFIITAVLFWRQIIISFSNSYFVYFWFGLGSLVIFEIFRIAVNKLRKVLKK